MSFLDPSKLKIGIPKKGRLFEPSISILKEAGYVFRFRNRALYATCVNAEIEFIFVRAADIPTLISKKAIDLGITGEDLVIEYKVGVLQNLLKLNYGICKLAIITKKDFIYREISQLSGKIVATSFPNLTANYFKEKKIKVSIIPISGSVEIMIALGVCDFIVDLVETGDSLKSNHLKIIEPLGNYECSLFTTKEMANKKEILHFKKKLEGILIARSYSMLEYNIPKEKLKIVEKITPGYNSPTVSSLDDEDLLSIRALVLKGKVFEIIDSLETIGAMGILELNIKNCRL